MGFHAFSLDPRTILGVGPDASPEEIHEAYRAKSKKHHPDRGGDEWAFRMVARAYEILTTARVVDRASNEVAPPSGPFSHARPTSEPEPQPKATWTNGFGPGQASASASASARPGVDPDSTINLKGWGGAARSHDGEPAADVARIVAVELLILRFELECSLDLFARKPEDRNLSCSLHITWPVHELAEQAATLPLAAKTLKRIGEAFKARGVRKHALNKCSSVEEGRFEGWLTYPTAVMASEALEAFREALAQNGLEVEKQVREMAIPRKWS